MSKAEQGTCCTWEVAGGIHINFAKYLHGLVGYSNFVLEKVAHNTFE